MEQEKTLQDRLDVLAAIAPDAAEYLTLFLDMVIEPTYEESYKDNPHAVLHCFPDGVDADVSEIIHYLEQVEGDLAPALQSIVESLHESRPVAFFVLKPVFRHFGIAIDGIDEYEDEPEVSYYIENRIFERRDLEKFFSACGLIEDTSSGKGSHSNWNDLEGRFIHSSTRSKKAYLRTVVKKMLRVGLTFDALAEGCRQMKVDFKLYND